MKPAVVIVGRPNVGKSTLFNRLVGEPRALVDPAPGVTRDRIYGLAREGGFIAVDTGGLVAPGEDEMSSLVAGQVKEAVAEADLVLFLLDGPEGLTPGDEELADVLRRSGKPVLYLVNKIDSPQRQSLVPEFYTLGAEELIPVSAAHGTGVGRLLERMEGLLPPPEAEEEEPEGAIRVAVVGRPNAGKSSLINRLAGEERLIVNEKPGTTRDAVDVEIAADGAKLLLVDTAGIRRRGKTTAKLEKLSVIKALRSIERCHVAVVVLDGGLGVAAQDMRIAGYVAERGRAAVVCLNKYDLLLEAARGEPAVREVESALGFLDYAPVIPTSALTGLNVGLVLPEVLRVFEQWNTRVQTALLNRLLEEALAAHQPPLVKGRRLKIYYIAQIRTRPPTFACVVNDPKRVHASYERYLRNRLRKGLGFDRTPVRLVFRTKRRKG